MRKVKRINRKRKQLRKKLEGVVQMRRRRNLDLISKKVEIEEEGKSFLADAGIVLGFLTGLGYLIAFSYKRGYKGYYGLDEMFLSDVKVIDILNAMTSISSVITFGYAVLQLFSGISSNDSENPVAIAFKYKFAPTAIFLIISSYALINDLKTLSFIGIYFIIMTIWIFFLNPFVFIKNEIGYKNRMRKYVQNVDKTSFIKKVKSLYKWNKPIFVFTAFIVASGAASFTSLYGSNKAEMEKGYTIIKQNNKDYVVIDNHEDNYILAPVNIKKATIKKEFIIIEGKSEFSKPIVFKHYNFKKGLKVE